MPLSPADQAAELLDGLSEPDALAVLAEAWPGVDLDELARQWVGWLARPDQLPPPGMEWIVWVLLGGRGSGKTMGGSEFTLERSIEFESKKEQARKRHRVALIARTPADVRDTMIEGDSGLIAACERRGIRCKYEPSKRRFTIPALSTAMTAFSAQVADALRGPQHHTAWADEPAAWGMTADSQGNTVWSNLELGMRLFAPGMIPRVCATTTPKPVPLVQEWVEQGTPDSEKYNPRIALTRATLYDNLSHLAPSFVQDIVDRYEGTTLALQEIHGILTNYVLGALWRPDRIDHVIGHPELARIVVGVDPPGGATECGIVVVGIETGGGNRRHAYVLEDVSIAAPAEVWAQQVITTANRWGADIVAEVNFGGDMVEAVIKGVDSSVSVVKVRAGKGQDKASRAQPVSALYGGSPVLSQTGEPLLLPDGTPVLGEARIHHVGYHEILESEMATWTKDEKWSPNRMDALVWAVHALFPGMLAAPSSSFTAQGRSLGRGAASVLGQRQARIRR